MNGALQGESLRDIDTQNILRCGAIYKRKGAPPCAGLAPLPGNNRNTSSLKVLQTFSYGF